ncbi:hypothetical protein GCM10011399_04960 [Subtercola lobariae]|uniref:Glycosyl transferase family 1 domain-containing protein n=1 Tax=Subtercola lobariae TaxID=1588641 RepID=A0A917B191_9MICO|nr:hypothetical protein GCM10011399_04960 [Subtercola lobariae]
MAVSGCFPDHNLLLGLSRDISEATEREAVARILHHCGVWATRHGSAQRRISVVDDKIVAFVNLTGRFGFNSGVQRVTRETLARWYPSGEIELTVMTDDGTALRALGESEADRVIAWNQTKSDDTSELDDDDFALIVPWRTTLFLPEIVSGTNALTLGALARFTPNTCVALVYDSIPASTGFAVPRLENLRFSTYLSMLKYFDKGIAISASSAEEFQGFTAALEAQGLRGPEITSVLLPIEHIPETDGADEPSADELPLVLSVGSNEPRKNQLAVIYAAEVLWRRGLAFRLQIVGGRGDTGLTEIGEAARALRSLGRSIEVLRDVDESTLSRAYKSARFSVFVSLHEGYGLPVAESLAVGTPVVTTRYGSTAEIAEGGGCILVDPRDDDEIVEAIASLLTDDTLLGSLNEQIDARRDATWDDYAVAIRASVTGESGALA